MFTHVFWIKFSLLVFCVICKKVLVTQSKTNIDRDRWVGGAWNCCRWLGKFHPLVRVKVIISLMRHVAWSGRSWMLTVRMRDVSCGKSLNCLTVFTQTSPPVRTHYVDVFISQGFCFCFGGFVRWSRGIMATHLTSGTHD